MSGGHFEYKDSSLRYEIFGWGDKWYNALEDREISELVWDVLDLIHDYDWYRSGDTREETYLESKAKFKKKWFGDNRGVRVRRIVDEAVEEARKELYKTFGIEQEESKE